MLADALAPEEPRFVIVTVGRCGRSPALHHDSLHGLLRAMDCVVVDEDGQAAAVDCLHLPCKERGYRWKLRWPSKFSPQILVGVLEVGI